MRVTLVHNPTAGDEAHSKGALLAMLRGLGHQVSYQSTKAPHWEDALQRPADLVVAAGGDGTVGKVAKRLLGSQTPLAILPLGTANNLAKALGSFGNLDELAESWDPDRPSAIDMGRCAVGTDDLPFVEAMGGGVVAEAMRAAERRADHLTSPGRGTDRALHLLADMASVARPESWHVVLDGEDLDGDYLGVEVMNTRFVSTNVPLAPGADPGDGLLDVVLIGADDGAALVRYLRDRLEQGAAAAPELPIRRGTTMRLRPPTGAVLHVDDATRRTADRADLQVTVEPRAVLVTGRPRHATPASPSGP